MTVGGLMLLTGIRCLAFQSLYHAFFHTFFHSFSDRDVDEEEVARMRHYYCATGRPWYSKHPIRRSELWYVSYSYVNLRQILANSLTTGASGWRVWPAEPTGHFRYRLSIHQ
jgi:hypothetical protein